MNMKLYAQQQGQGNNIISLHGLFGSLNNLGTINRNLAKSFRVHGLDIRNHGRSPHDNDMSYSQMASDIIEYMDDQRLDTANLIGHSMGGKIAMSLALQAPERINKLVVIDISPAAYEVKHDSVLEGLSAIDLHVLQQRSDADALLLPYVEEKEVRQFLLKNIYRDEHGYYKWRINLSAIKKTYCRIIEGLSANKPFNGDILFLKGSNSDYILPSHKEKILSLFPKATVKIITDTGHWLHAQKPALVCRYINRFFTG